jgi:hypothetical protein
LMIGHAGNSELCFGGHQVTSTRYHSDV